MRDEPSGAVAAATGSHNLIHPPNNNTPDSFLNGSVRLSEFVV